LVGKGNPLVFVLKLDELFDNVDSRSTIRALYCGASEPEWLALVPQSIYGPDIDDMMLRHSRDLRVSRLETGDGDIVFAGCQ